MEVDVQVCSKKDKFIINNIYPLYLHDLSEIWERKTNQYGVFEENDIKTLADQNAVFDIWWEKPDVLFPYLITVDQLPAGLAFVATPPYVPSSADFYLNEFFVLRYYRGKGVGEQAAAKVFNQFRGSWELQTGAMPRNARAQKFWRSTLAAYTNAHYSESLMNDPEEGNKIVFRFVNA